MNKPFISFIVPVYGVENYLHECIDSIICQQGNWELILIDDGSPDKCPEICDRYAAKEGRIKVIHQNNKGVAEARNTGLGAAKGKWIWFVDSDDFIEKDGLQQLLPLIKNQDYDVVQFTMRKLINNELKDVMVRPPSQGMPTEELLLKYPCYNNVAMLFKREIIEKNNLRFTQGIRLGEDMEFQLKCLLFCRKAVQFPVSLYIYRIRSGSATNSLRSRAYLVNDTSLVMSNLLIFVQKHHLQPKIWFLMRIRGMMSNLLYSASLVPDINRKELQTTVRNMMDAYANAGLHCFDTVKMRLAYVSVTLYFMMNRIYLKAKGLS